MVITRIFSAILGLTLLAGCASQMPAPALSIEDHQRQSLPAAEHIALTVQGRTVDLSIYRPVVRQIGAIFVSHGAGSSPARLEPLIDRIRGEGFVVLAPLHGDSLLIPEEQRQDIRAALATRIADMQAVGAYSDRTFPELPYGAVGHSYGSLIALIGGGALAQMFDAQVPAIEAVAMFSSPGIIPGLTEPEGRLETISVPTLMITGTKDAVEPFARDPESHISYFERQAEGSTLLLVSDASHNFVYGNEPHYDEAIDLLVTFLRAEITRDAAAEAGLEGARSTSAIEIRRR